MGSKCYLNVKYFIVYFNQLQFTVAIPQCLNFTIVNMNGQFTVEFTNELIINSANITEY